MVITSRALWVSHAPLPRRLRAGLPPYSPVFKSWIHCWKYLSTQVSKLPEVPEPATGVCGRFTAWKDKGCHGIQGCEEDKENVNADLV